MCDFSVPSIQLFLVKIMPERLMIDATHLEAHRAAASLLKKELLHYAT